MDAVYLSPRAEPPTPSINDRDSWRRLLNSLYLHEEDELFRWPQNVRAAVCRGEWDEHKRQPRSA